MLFFGFKVSQGLGCRVFGFGHLGSHVLSVVSLGTVALLYGGFPKIRGTFWGSP